MATLVIETATPACSVAVLRDGVVLAEMHEEVGRGHAERLVPMIGKVLAAASLARADAVLVDCGPGSFTGIRVGLAAARALGLAWSAPVRGYSSLAALAAGGESTDAVTAAIAGGHGELFLQRFSRAPFAALDQMVSLIPEEAANSTADQQVIGSGARALIEARGHGTFLDILPRASDARLLPPALRDLPPSPLYGRLPDARPKPS